MKVLDLQCFAGHSFEGWFASHEEFEAQHARGLVDCPACGDKRIIKRLSAPRLNLNKTKEIQTPPVTTPADSSELQGRWMRAVRELLHNTEDVGERFCDEARKIHHGEVPERGIRGQATPDQVEELLEDGIAVMPFDVPAGLKETLQ